MNMNNQDIFLNRIYRNSYIRKIIFKQIKQINKSLKYIRFNFYDTPLSLIINNKNEQMLIEKLKLHQIQRKKQYESNNINYEDYYNHYLDFNLKDYNLLLKWKNLNLSTFKIYFNHFQIEIKQQSNLIDSYQILVLDNGVSVDILKFVLSNYNQNEINSLSSIKKDKSLLKISQYSIKMFNYLFRFEGNINLFKEIYQTADTILSSLSVSFRSKETNQQVLKEIINSFSMDFTNKLIDSANWEYFINVLVESNNLEIFKVLLNKLTSIDNDINSNNNVELYGFKISIKLLSKLRIGLQSFNSDDTMFDLFKILVEKVMVDRELFSELNPHNSSIKINGPDYSDYIIEKLKENNVQLFDSKFKFTHKCQRNLNECTSKQLKNNYSLIDIDINFNYDSFKSPLLNQDLKLFEVFFSRFGFSKSSFLEALELGYENMVVYILDKPNHQLILGLQHGGDIKFDFYFDVFLKSLPSDTSDGFPLLYETLLPIIDEIISGKIIPTSKNDQVSRIMIDLVWKPLPMFFQRINNTILPLDPIKRKLFIERISRIKDYSNLKSVYFKSQFSVPVGNSLNNICLPDFIDMDKSIYETDFQSEYQKNNFFTRIFIDCLFMGSFKLIKKIASKFTPTIYSWRSINSKIPLKLLFYTILGLGIVKLDNIETLFPTTTELTPKLLPDIKNSQISFIFDYNVNTHGGINPQFINLILGYNEFKNFNFFYTLTKGKSSSQHLDLVSADKYLIISQLLLINALGRNETDKLLNWPNFNPIIPCKHFPENSNFIQQLLNSKNDKTYIGLVKREFDIEKSLLSKHKPIVKLFDLIK